MRTAAAALLLLVVACSSSSPAAAVRQTPQASPTSATSPAPSPSGSPTAISSPSPVPPASPTPLTQFALPDPIAVPPAPTGGCALPVDWADPQSNVKLDTAFMLYPGGGVVSPQAIGGQGEAFYDQPAGRWLPVGPEQVSPDGLTFAYADYDLPPPPASGMAGESRPRAAGALATTGRVYLIDARTGRVTLLYSGSPTYSIAGFTYDGIYLSQVLITMDGYFYSGLYLMKTAGGKPVAVPGGDRPLDRGGWTVVNGAAFGTEFSTGGGITSGNQLVVLDLHGNGATVWLTRPEGTALSLDGVDHLGRLLVSSYPSGYSSTGSPAPTPPMQLLALQEPQKPVVLWSHPDANVQPPFGPVFAYGDQTWIGEAGAVWLVGSTAVTPVAVATANDLVRVGNRCF